ncbi:PQQ-dependent sugar dehydrogenase [Gordonia sp. HY002]|uniref:PQQ-dependent sugar dehydrogenase n=1 Tax=Gordonia zhenghanii TaxID=2911516 RepID=UPI001EF0EE99|nr:PQQ-dependent sugar dehydrogenase [Gordonia zhenghanii]MCF8569439.1 PQQ-dependent sugar dehydrogenase [Gordonia zhenghanii]MCF8602390.1 PQQ-dependent sugar dehydrogenase [Gordonia zhenghanii]
MKRSALAVAVSVLALAPAACAADEPRTRPTSAVRADAVVAQDLDSPWSIAFYGATPLVSERDSARVLELDAAGTPREVAVIDDVEPSGEGGLLGIAVHEDFLYTYFTADDENRVQRFPIAGDAGALTLGEPETLIDDIPAASNHNGGRIAFGPDGMLYVTTGDAGEAENAQDSSSLSGKILRLTPDGAVPDDNPFPGSPVYSFGHRNPQGIAWADDGTMYASEFGQDTWDELNVVEPGRNYGWPDVEGVADRSGFVDPIQQWSPSEASPSGIAVVGDDILIANLRGESLRRVPRNGRDTSTETFTDLGRLRDVVVAPNGEVWVVTNNTDGRGDPADGDDRIMRAR